MVFIQAGIIAGQDDPRSGHTQGPDLVSLDEADVWLHSQGRKRPDRRGDRLLKMVLVVGCNASHIGARGNVQHEGAISVEHQDLVGDVERVVCDAVAIERTTKVLLGALGGIAQRLVDEPALLFFGRELGGRTQVCFL